MKKKAEIIKEAWIAEIGEEKYNEFSSYINENGWLKKGHVFIQSVNELDWSEGGLRPKSLRDFEHNNGWHRIDEVGLPKEAGTYWVVQKDGKIIQRPYFNISKSKGIEDKDWLNQYTHYQPLNKPQPPIY